MSNSYFKPHLQQFLHAIGLDRQYHRGEGDYLWYEDADGCELRVLDLVGGYGASLLGHNNSEVVQQACKTLNDARPIHGQAALRIPASNLAKRLERLVTNSVGGRYQVVLTNSGSEAVEACLKHAELEAIRRHQSILKDLDRSASLMDRRLGHDEALSSTLFRQGQQLLRCPEIKDVNSLVDCLRDFNRRAFDRTPACWALEGSFHGKTLGAVQATHHCEFRDPWRRFGIGWHFLTPDHPTEVNRALREAVITFVDIEFDQNGAPQLKLRTHCNVTACLVEPIQGEGGIREISSAFLRRLREAADEGGFPLVFDEIQSGMGRTGTFLASENSGVRADYYLFSKALGGGVAKVGATLIDRQRYRPEFDLLHTSTFAEDDFSSTVALTTLDIIERDNGELMRQCRVKGELLLTHLRRLQEQFPFQIADVRGRGLMVGLELASQHQSSSPLLRLMSDQKLLGFVVANYLLFKHQIRILPTLSSRMTLRIEPSAFVATSELVRFCDSMEQVLILLRDSDIGELVRYLFRDGHVMDCCSLEEKPTLAVKTEHTEKLQIIETSHQPTVALISHFLEPGDLREWDPSLAIFSEAECARFFRRSCDLIDPFVAGDAIVRSCTGKSIRILVIGLALTSQQAIDAHKNGGSGSMVNQIQAAVLMAKELGASVVGLGAYTSIVTDNGRLIYGPDITITTGNSLTAAAALEATSNAQSRFAMQKPKLGIVGAGGSIGSILAQCAADHIGNIVLVGKPRSERRLKRVASKLYQTAFERIHDRNPSGVASAMLTKEFQGLISLEGGSSFAAEDRSLPDILMREGPVTISTDLNVLRECNLILTATNSPKLVITADHIGTAPCVICDVATPSDVDIRIKKERPNSVLLRGGTVKLPNQQVLAIGGMPLPPGEIYGCLAETILHGLNDIRDSLSYGPLKAENVRRVRELMNEHGFVIEECPL